MSGANEREKPIPAGEQLKHLRERQNLSVQDIASRLNLEVRIIEAIENNNLEILSAATYARGYLRAYAKILKVDPETIVLSYNDTAPEPPEIIPEIKYATQTSSHDKPVKAFTYLISLIFVILLIAWWQSNFIVDSLYLSDSNNTQGDAEQSYKLSYTFPVIEHPSSPFYRAETATEQHSAVPDEADTGAQADMDSSSGKEPREKEPKRKEQYPKLVTSDNRGSDTLVLRLTADSWIEIFDSLENKVFVNLARQDQVLSLQGTAPFSVVLGFAKGVSIEFNGRAFDTKPFTKGGIARFNLDR